MLAIAKQSRKKVKPAVNRSHENDRLVPSDLDSVNTNKMMSSGLGGWSFLLYLISSKFLKSSKIPESEPKMPRKRSTKKYFARTFPATRWCNIICLIKSKNMSLLKFNDFSLFHRRNNLTKIILAKSNIQYSPYRFRFCHSARKVAHQVWS